MRAHLASALALAAAATAAGPAAAQYVNEAPGYAPVYDDGAYVDELVVTGPVRNGRPTRLSQAVDIRDLDLATYEGRLVLKHRIRDTARDLCRALGESEFNGGSVVPSCVDQAIRDARPQVRVAVNQAYARSYYASLDTRGAYAPLP